MLNEKDLKEQLLFHRLTKTNIVRVKICASIAICLELFLLGRNFYYHGISFHYYVQLYLALLTASIVILISIFYINKIQDEHKRLQTAHKAMFVYYLFTLIWGVTVTLIDQMSYGHVTAYLTNLLIACSLFISKKRTFIYLHTIPIVMLVIGFIVLVTNPTILSGHFINVTVFWIFAALCSRLIYLQMAKSFEQELRLNEQNKELNRLNQHLEFLANKDPLTGLANRNYLKSYLRSKLAKPQNMTIMMIDIDDFKQYNDYYGHLNGDEVLKQIAKVLHTTADKYDLFAARIGGEEFIVIGHDLSKEQAKMIANEICCYVEQLHIPHEKSKTEPYVTISLGFIVNKVNMLSDFDTTLHLADQALYKAKQNGRNQTYCYQ